jgi:hypothetical protein
VIRPILLTVLPGAVVSAFLDWRAGVGTTVVSAGWLLFSWFRPLTKCNVCGGDPKNRSKSGNSWNKYCPGCKSSGERRRLGSILLGRGFGKM